MSSPPSLSFFQISIHNIFPRFIAYSASSILLLFPLFISFLLSLFLFPFLHPSFPFFSKPFIITSFLRLVLRLHPPINTPSLCLSVVFPLFYLFSVDRVHLPPSLSLYFHFTLFFSSLLFVYGFVPAFLFSGLPFFFSFVIVVVSIITTRAFFIFVSFFPPLVCFYLFFLCLPSSRSFVCFFRYWFPLRLSLFLRSFNHHHHHYPIFVPLPASVSLSCIAFLAFLAFSSPYSSSQIILSLSSVVSFFFQSFPPFLWFPLSSPSTSIRIFLSLSLQCILSFLSSGLLSHVHLSKFFIS